jgi:glycosyltransferase involved in cell wall biosynthesis
LVHLHKLSIVIPVYNEGRTIYQILDLLRTLQLVNDCSTDNSVAAIEAYAARYPEMELRLLLHSVNQGKGAALHTGIRQATGDYVIIQDADLEYATAKVSVASHQW